MAERGELQLTETLSISLGEIEIRAVRSQGAGGQNVNKVATAVHLRFDIAGVVVAVGPESTPFETQGPPYYPLRRHRHQGPAAAQPGSEPGRGAAPPPGSRCSGRGDAAQTPAHAADIRVAKAPSRRQDPTCTTEGGAGAGAGCG